MLGHSATENVFVLICDMHRRLNYGGWKDLSSKVISIPGWSDVMIEARDVDSDGLIANGRHIYIACMRLFTDGSSSTVKYEVREHRKQ